MKTIEKKSGLWFQTWDRPEYLEWALTIPEGYLLHIIRKERNGFLVVEAKLIMGDSGLPAFEIVRETKETSQLAALQRLQSWGENLFLNKV